ncbi:MAG: peptidase S41, partial [Candidatus Omnitrophica bacterium]|nr:peptidase S41 [Candidatus Omnitrophota bacterium]
IGYIRLVHFGEDTEKNISLALNNLTKEKFQGLILDLRNNPGGLLDVAVKVAGKFIPEGKVLVFTKGRKNKQNLEFFSDEKKPVLNVPMAILINQGSASGSEIVAAALQYYRRAVIIGTTSFGKGSVQTVIPLSDGTAIKLTTSKYFTPDSKEISGKGVTPDIIVEESPQAPEETQDTVTTEEVFKKLEKESKQPKKEDKIDYKSDQTIQRAMDLLKAIKFYKGFDVNEK